MKTIIQVITIVLFSTIFLYSQIAEDTWEIQVDNVRSVEPALAINPINNNILVAYMEYSNTNPRILYKLIDQDGEEIPSASGVISTHASDPDVIFDSYGNAYVCFLDGVTSNSVSIKRSTDGGYTFENSVIVRGGANGNDKPFFTIDKNPGSPYFNRIYISYTNFCTSSSDANIEIVYTTNTNPGVGNLTFSVPQTLLESCSSFQGENYIGGAFPIVNPNNNQLYLFWLKTKPGSIAEYYFNSSLNGGFSFDESIQIMDMDYKRPGVLRSGIYRLKDELNVSYGFRYTPFPFAAIDAASNTIYLIASATADMNYDFSIADRFILWKSSDNGLTWSTEEVSNFGKFDLFMPYINSDDVGRIFITNYNSAISPYDNYITDLNVLVPIDEGGNTSLDSFFRTQLFAEDYSAFDLKRVYIGTDVIGDYIEAELFNDNLYIAYSRTIDPPGIYATFVHLLKLPIAVSTKFENQYSDNGQPKNDLGSFLINETLSFNSPVQKPVKLFEQFSVEPEETFYDPLKFYNWKQPDNTRIPQRTNEEVSIERNEFFTFFHQTKPLTVRNYFEGVDGSTIYFGEYEFDEDDRDSPHFENAFIYNPPDVPAQYIAVAELSHSDLFGTDWNFVKWEDGTVNRTRQENIGGNTAPEWKAMYKGQLTSDDLEGLSSNSQRKLVRTDDDIYYLVYESLGDIWYTKSLSANFQGSWSTEISLSREYDYDEAKNPSIDYYGNNLAVAFEAEHFSGIKKIICLLYDGSSWGSSEDITDIELGYFGNAKPVVAYTPHELFVCYRNSALEGLKYSCRHLQDIFWSTESLDSYTDANSTNPTIASKKFATGTPHPQEVHIVYQQGTTQIKYAYGYKNTTGSGNWVISYPDLISGGNGFVNNEYPSVSLRKNSTYWDPVVSWTGRRKEKQVSKISAKVNGWVYVYRTVVRPKSAGWGSFYVAGSNVDFTNNNSTNNTTEETVIAC